MAPVSLPGIVRSFDVERAHEALNASLDDHNHSTMKSPDVNRHHSTSKVGDDTTLREFFW